MTSSKEKFVAKIPNLDFSDGIDMLKDFSQEAQRHLITVRNMLLVLETMPSDMEAIGTTFKTFHTIGGMSNFLMLDDIFALTAEVEKLLDLARKDIVILDAQAIELISNAANSLQKLLELLDEQIQNEGKLQTPYHDVGSLITSIQKITNKKSEITHQPKSTTDAMPTIQFEPSTSAYTELKNQIPHDADTVSVNSAVLRKLISDFDDIRNELKLVQSKLKERQRELVKERKFAIKLTRQSQVEARAKSDYLANMSHEIRTLINAILGFTDILSKGHLNDRQQSHVNTIVVSGNMLLSIVNDILDFSKVEAGKLKLEHISFDIEHITEEIFKIIRTKLEGKPINLFFEIDEQVSRNLIGDPTRLKQIFMNLLDNAIKFTEKGEIGMRIFKEDPSGILPGEHLIHFVFSDTGIGIPKDTQKEIFKSYSQADSATTRVYGGTGLGLTLCKTFVEKMGGEITVKSESGKGSQFHFTLKFPESDTSVIARDIFPTSTFDKTEVMIVDKFTPSAKALSALCSLAKIKVLPITTSAKQASEFLLKHESQTKSLPSIIFIDTLLPNKEGFMLAYKVRQQDRYQNVKLVALSSDVKIDSTVDFRQAGFDTLLTKPIIRNELMDILLQTLEHKKAKKRYISHDMIDKISCEDIKVLVVEDSMPNQELLKVHLESLGCIPEFAVNGQEAIDLLKEKSYDICFMDLHMPVIDGLAATEIIRKNMKLSVPIIALTAAEVDEEKERCYKIGMQDYLAKPFDIQELKEKIIRCTKM